MVCFYRSDEKADKSMDKVRKSTDKVWKSPDRVRIIILKDGIPCHLEAVEFRRYEVMERAFGTYDKRLERFIQSTYIGTRIGLL